MVKMKILYLCDPPVGPAGQNVGGVHAVVAQMRREYQALGHTLTVVAGDIFNDVPSGVTVYEYLKQTLDGMDFDAVHIVTQTRLGFLGLRYCVERNLAFTTTYDTLIPEYLDVRHNVPKSLGYGFMRWFLNSASCVIVPTPSIKTMLEGEGINNVVSNLHGVDTEMFKPGATNVYDGMDGPILLYVGRITPEKNPEDFFRLKVPGTKVAIGGPSGGLTYEELQEKYPDVHFLGVRKGEELAEYYRGANVLVFPSKSDTFGMVQTEALASGTPVVAYPVPGPIDVITDERVGVLDYDLEKAIARALTLKREDCREFALKNHLWADSAKRFVSEFVPCRGANNHQGDAQRGLLPLGMSYDTMGEIIGHTATVLFADEPAGPYSGGAKP